MSKYRDNLRDVQKQRWDADAEGEVDEQIRVRIHKLNRRCNKIHDENYILKMLKSCLKNIWNNFVYGILSNYSMF